MPGAERQVSLSRGTPAFVGRRAELRWLHDRIEDAGAGQPGLVIVEGDPGIGKSRLVRVVGDEAAGAGVRVIWCRAYEQVQSPFGPFVESLFPLLEALAVGRPDPASRLVGHWLGTLGAPEHDESPDRFRLLGGLTRLIADLARRQPTLLVVEDVQWADPETLDLLRHLAFRFADSSAQATRLLAVATCRPSDEPTAAAVLAALRQEEACVTLTLEGLDRAASAALVRDVGLPDATGDVVDALLARTGGNPLFLRSLAERLATVPGQTTGDLDLAVLPGELGTVIDEHLGKVSPACGDLLDGVAVVGPGCGVDMLSAIVGASGEIVDRLVGEAVEGGILVVAEGTVGFVHPLYAQTCSARLRGEAREQVHARIANALVNTRGGDDAIVSTIVRHLAGAGHRVDASLLVEYGVRAGERAFAAAAWGEAARCFELAIDGATRQGLAPAELGRLRQRAGAARTYALDLEVALEHLDNAVEAYADVDDDAALVRVHVERSRVLVNMGAYGDRLDIAPLEAALDRLGDADPRLRAMVLIDVSLATWMRGELTRSLNSAQEAFALAEDVGDDNTAARAALQHSIVQWSMLDLNGALENLRIAAARARTGGEPVSEVGSTARLPLPLLWLGRIAEARVAIDDAVAVAQRVNFPIHRALPLAALAAIDALTGDVDSAVDRGHEAHLLQGLTGYTWANGLLQPALVSALVGAGRFDEARARLAEWAAGAQSPGLERAAIRVAELWLRAHAGETSEIALELAGKPLIRPGLRPAIGASAWCAAAVEVADLVGEPGLAGAAEDVLTAASERGEVVTSGLVFLVPRALGLAAALAGRLNDAVDRLENAIAVAFEIGADAERIRATVDLARTLARRATSDDLERAEHLLSAVLPEIDALGLGPQRQRLAFVAEVLGRRLPPPPRFAEHGVTDELSVILFIDVSGSTRLTAELGDAAYLERASTLEPLLRETIGAHGGRVAVGITLGDGVLAVFEDAEDAVDCGVACLHRAPPTGLPVHVGIHAGQVVWQDGVPHGHAVNVAARVCDRAPVGTVYVSEAVRRLLGSTPYAFDDRGRHELKGVEAPQRLFALELDKETLATAGG